MGPELVAELRKALTCHPEFLDIWADMEAGRPEYNSAVEMSIKIDSRFAQKNGIHGFYDEGDE